MATTRIPTYVPRPMGTIDGGVSTKYLQAELASISQSIKSIVAEIDRINTVLVAHGIT
jgi:hypothetical protein